MLKAQLDNFASCDDGINDRRIMLFLGRGSGYRLGKSKVLPRWLSGSEMILVRSNKRINHRTATRMHLRRFHSVGKATKGGRKVGTGGTRDLASEGQPHQHPTPTRSNACQPNTVQQRHPFPAPAKLRGALRDWGLDPRGYMAVDLQ